MGWVGLGWVRSVVWWVRVEEIGPTDNSMAPIDFGIGDAAITRIWVLFK